MTSVTTHFKKLTTGNNVFIVSVIVESNSHTAVFTSNVQCARLAAVVLDDALKPATSLTNGAINETLRQFAPLSDMSQASVAIHLRCGGIFRNIC